MPDSFPLPDVPPPPAPTPSAPAPKAPETNREKLVSVAKGALIAAAGAALTFLASPAVIDAAKVDPRLYILITLAPILVNAIRKFFPDLLPAATKTLPLLLVSLLALSAVGCQGIHYETGEAAKAKISGTDKVKAGGMFRLSADGSTGQLKRWTFPAALEAGEYDGGRTLAGVARMVGGATVTLEVLSIHNGRLERDIATTVVQVEGDAPPAPGPTPQPVPPAPGPSSVLGDVARSQAVALVCSPSRKAEGVKVGGVFRSVASGVEGGSISTGSAAVGAITSRIDEGLGAAAPPWQQWLRAIAPRINDACPEMRDLPKGLRDVAGGVEVLP